MQDIQKIHEMQVVHLDEHCPGGEVALCDGVVKVPWMEVVRLQGKNLRPDGVVRVLLGHLVGLVPVKTLDPLVGLVVELAVDRLVVTVHHLECVGAVPDQ